MSNNEFLFRNFLCVLGCFLIWGLNQLQVTNKKVEKSIETYRKVLKSMETYQKLEKRTEKYFDYP